MAALLAVTSFAALSVAAPAGPAGAAPQPFTLAMVPGGGQLTLAGNDPFQLETPTSFTGTIDDATGVLSNLAFSTPDIEFQQDAGGLLVDVIAKFTLLSATGNADGLGNVVINAAVRVDVNLNVGGGAIITDCVASPVNITLVSTSPYNPDTQQVTIADPNFTIPPVVGGGDCNPLVVEPLNDALAGPGNTFSLTLEGDLALPPPPGAPSTTTLTSDVATTTMGFPVTFTAEVAPGEGADPELDVPLGAVLFFNGPTQIGQAQLDDDSKASFTTSTLPVGVNQITARYNGNVDYDGSTSAPLAHTVTAIPAVTATLPDFLIPGGDPVEFTASITNPSLGATVPNLRLDMIFGALTGLTAGNLVLEWDNGGTWEVLPSTAGTATVRRPQFPGATGFSMAPGETREVTFRIAVAASVGQGRLPVAFTLVNVDPDSEPTPGAILTTYNRVDGETWVIGTERRPTAAALTVVRGTRVNGPTPRVGDNLTITGNINRGGGTPLPNASGEVELYIDGELFHTQPVPTTGGITIALVAGPDSPLNDLAAGNHVASVQYKGDNVYQPSVSPPFAFTLAPWIGERYTCAQENPLQSSINAARVDVHAITPVAALPGATVPLRNLEVTYWTQGSPGLHHTYSNLAFNDDRTLSFTGGATGTFVGFQASTQPAGAIEGYGHMTGEEASVEIVGEPGDVIDIDFLGYDGTAPFLPDINASYSCAANHDQGERVASITVAGTTVSTAATNPVEVGTPVPLTANVFPATAQGLVEFYVDGTPIGLAPVSEGVAQVNASGLTVGAHEITARYLGDLVVPASVSEPVAVVVRDAILCPSQAVEGSGAVVRSTYLNLLGRCAEPLGFSYWTGQLDGGLSAETFARQVASSLEAHGRSVDDGYQLILGRNADAGGRAFWAQRLNSGQRYDALLGDLAASNEFWTAAGSTNNGYVTRLYDRLLHRAPDTAGLNYWVGRLSAGQSRASVAAAFVRLPEPSGQIVSDAYRNILDRGPTADERTPAVTAFQGDGHRWRIYSALIGTEEFFDRSQTFPNPS